MQSAEEPYFEIFIGKNDLVYWHLVGANGEVMAQSEGYVNVSNAKRAVKRFKEAVAEAGKNNFVQATEDEETPEPDEQED